MAIGVLRPGATAQSVLPLAAQAARELAIVEAFDLTVVAGAPRIVVRFTAEDGDVATQIGDHTAAVTDTAAEVRGWEVTQRAGGRWQRVAG
jgi:hypothetical protein